MLRANNGGVLNAVVIGAISLLASGAGAQVTYRTVALSDTDGEYGPGLGAGVQFGNNFIVFNPKTFDAPVIDQHGAVAFPARLSGSGIDSTNFTGLWKITPTSREPVIRQGDSVSATVGAHIGQIQTVISSSGVYFPTLINQGRVLVGVELAGDGVDESSDIAVMIHDESGSRVILREGQASPFGPAGSVIRAPQHPQVETDRSPLRLNRNGLVQINTRLMMLNGSSLTAIWEWTSESGLSIALGPGLPVPGIEGETVSFVSGEHLLNSTGATAATARFGAAPSTEGLFLFHAGKLSLALTDGNPAPGTQGAMLDSVGVKSFNDAGDLILAAELAGGDVIGSLEYGIYRWSDGGLELLLRDNHPSAWAGGIQVQRTESVRTNSAGDIAFIDGPLTRRMILVRDQVATVLLQEGQFLQDSMNPVSWIGEPVMNGHSQVAFGVNDNGFQGGTQFNGLVATDRSGAPHLIARTGGMFEVAPNDYREIDYIHFVGDSGGEDGLRMSFNDRGELAFKLVFEDGTGGIFVATIDPIICPGDVSGDFHVSIDDLNMILSAWNTSVPMGTLGDADESGTVDIEDLNIVLSAWGTACD